MSAPQIRPKSKRSVKFDFVPVPVPVPVSPVPPVAKPSTKSLALSNRRALRRAKKKKMNATQKWQVELRDIYPHLLASLPLPDEYKTNHLLDPVADISPDLTSVVEPVSLNAVTVQTTFMPLADITPWHHDDVDPVPVY